MYVIGFILVIGGIWLLWRDNTVEGMADTSTVVMAALSSNNTYFADVGLTNLPNWSAAGGAYKQISGSMGRLIGVDSNNRAYYGTKFDISGSAFNWLAIPGEVKQVSFDYPMVVGLRTTNMVVYIDNIPSNPQTATWKSVGGSSASKTFNYIAMNNAMAVGAGTDNRIWYCSDIRAPTWLDISTGLLAGIVVKNIAFDGDDVAVVDTNNIVYFANNMGEVNDNVGVAGNRSEYSLKVGATPEEVAAHAAAASWQRRAAAAAPPGTPVAGVMPNWKTLAKRMKQVSIRNHMGLGIGEDNRIYFAASLKDGNWGATGSPATTPIWAELYYPVGGDVISFRPAGMSIRGVSPCPFGYTLSGTKCYSNCPVGYKDNGETCSYLATVAGAQVAVNDIKNNIESCTSGYSLTPTGGLKCNNLVDGTSFPLTTGTCPTNHASSATNVCMTTCPSGFTSTLNDCIPPTAPKPSTPALTNLYRCPSGTTLTSDNQCIGSCPAGYIAECTGIGTNALKCSGKCIYDINSTSAKQPYKPASISATSNTPYNVLPNNTDDQTIQLRGTVQYVRIRPSSTSGDGHVNLSQIIVLDTNGINIARGKTVTASSTYPGDDPPSTVVDGSATLRKPSSSNFVSRYAKATLAPVKWQNIGTNITYPATNNIGSPIAVTDLADAQKKCIETAGCSGFSMTTGSSPTAQLMNITSSTPYTAIPPLNTFTFTPASIVWTTVGANRAYPVANNIGSRVAVTDLADAKAKCLADGSCSGFSITSGSNPTMQMLNITESTPSSPSYIMYTASTRAPTWNAVGTNMICQETTYIGSPIQVTDLADAQSRCLNTPGCTGFSFEPSVPPVARLMTITSSTGCARRYTTSGNAAAWGATANYQHAWQDHPDADILAFVGTVDAAKAKCLATPGCTEFAYAWGTNYLRNIPYNTGTWSWWNGLTTHRLADSILTQTPSLVNTLYTVSDPTWNVITEQHHSGSDILSFAGSISDGKARCLATPDCTEFAHFQGTNYLKKVPLNTESRSPLAGCTTYRLKDEILKAGMENSKNTIYTVSDSTWVAKANYQHAYQDHPDADILAFVGSVDAAKAKCLATPGCTEFAHAWGTNYLRNIPYNTGTWSWWNGLTTYRLADEILKTGSSQQNGNTVYIYSDPNWDVTVNKGHFGDDILSFTGSISEGKAKCVDTPGCTEFVSYRGIIYIKNIPFNKASRSPLDGCTTYSLTNTIQEEMAKNTVIPSNGVWGSATNNRTSEFIEVDLGSNTMISAVRLIGRADYNFTTNKIDRMTGVIIQLYSSTSGARVEVKNENDCRSGYFKESNMCIENCREGYYYSGTGGTCVFGQPVAAPTTPATYTPPCPSDKTQVGSLCYSPCPAGSTDTGSNTCRPANTRRTQGPAPTVVPFRLCNAPLVYVQSINACSPVCPTGTTPIYSGGQTTCTKNDVNRTSTDPVASYSCNANEILRNGVCVTKCPDGSAPDGDLCVPQMQIVDLKTDANINCLSSAYQGSKKWMCESADDFKALVTNPTPTTTYISPTDQICVTESSTTKMYFCITGAEAKSGLNPLTSMKPDFNKTCQSITKSYRDLSNNLTNLIKIRDGMQDGSTKLGTAKNSLNSIYGQMNCASASGTKATLCSQIQTAASSIGTNSSDVTTTLDTVIPKLEEALNSRDSLLGYKSKFQCP